MVKYGACMHSKSLQLCPTLGNPTDYSRTGSSGLARQEYWSMLMYPLARDAPHLGFKPQSCYISCIGRNIVYRYRPLGSTKYWYICAIFGSNSKNNDNNKKTEKGKG